MLLDATPVSIAFSPGGQAAVGFGFVNPDAPAGARAEVAQLSASGRALRVRVVPHTRQVLDLTYVGSTLQLLGGTSGGGLACCTEIQTLALGSRGFSAPRPLIRRLSGVALGRLIDSGSGTLAVFATNTGVWAARAGRDGRFGAVRRLTSSGIAPQSLVAMPVRGGGPLLAFTQARIQAADTPSAPSVMVSRGTGPGLPPRPHAAQTFPAGTAIGPLALAAAPSAPTLGWTQDATDGTGSDSSTVVLAAVGQTLRTRTFSGPGQYQSGLSAAADAAGDELFAWESCDQTPECQVVAVGRPSGGRFGTTRTLGTIDAGAEPAVAIGPHGGAAIAWVQGGRIYVTRRGSGTQRFSKPQRLAGPGPVSGLRLAAGPGGRLLAVWVAGTTRTTVWASQFR